MKAAKYHAFGDPDVVNIKDVALPEVGSGQILVRVHAATVSASDAAARSGTPWFTRLAFGVFKPNTPVLGSDFAGRVAKLGSGAHRFEINDLVFGATNAAMGAHAEYIVVSDDSPIERIPENIDAGHAAALVDSTALAFLRDSAGLQQGQRLLINGASGAVGSVAVQLAKHMGAHVTGTSSAQNLDFVRSLGTDAALDYTDFDTIVEAGPYDIVFDAYGKLGYQPARRALTPNGLYMTTVPSVAILLQSLWTEFFSRRTARVAFAGLRPSDQVSADLRKTAELMRRGVLTPHIDGSYPLDRVAAAHRHVDQGKRGHVILALDPGEEHHPTES